MRGLAPRSLPAPLTALVLTVGCGGPARPPQLLLITIDTLRADHLACYGYSRATSPAIDRLADEAVVFDEAQAHSSWTLPSLGALLTGLTPEATRLVSYDSSLGDAYTTLAELLAERGFRTAGVGSHVFLEERFGLRQGFGEFDDDLVKATFVESHEAITSEQVSDKGIERLEELAASGAPWFLWLHYFDPHFRYAEHPENERSFGEEPIDLYDGEILFTDRHVGRVLARLEELGLADATVLLAADHGEEFGDHGGQRHGRTLYQEVLRVPLLLRTPGLAPRRIAERVRLVDVLPTLLELLGIPASSQVRALEGESLLSLLRGGPRTARPVLGTLGLRRHETFDALIEDGWKLVVPRYGGASELYDLARDPTERSDVALRESDRVERLTARLRTLLEATRATAERHGSEARLETSAEELRSLEQLGYVGDDEL